MQQLGALRTPHSPSTALQPTKSIPSAISLPPQHSHARQHQHRCCHVPPPLPTPAAHSSTQAPAQPLRQGVIAAAGFGFGKSKAGSSKAASKDCPCGSGKLYSKCCEVFHKSAAAHPDPERLVKARYSAFVKRLPKFLRATSHPDNPALKGSQTTLEDATVKTCSYEEDVAMSMLCVEYTGFTVLGSEVSADGASCSVDARATFKRLVDSTGRRIGKPQEEVWLERATLLKDDDGNWLVQDVHPIEPAAAAEVPGAEALGAAAGAAASS